MHLLALFQSFNYFLCMEIKTLKQAEDFLFSRHATALKLGLDNIKKLTELIGHPENKIKSIHIAGTNGKGSTVAILESVLCEAGYKTLLYTSPHLWDVKERLRICRKKISETDFINLIERMRIPAFASPYVIPVSDFAVEPSGASRLPNFASFSSREKFH